MPSLRNRPSATDARGRDRVLPAVHPPRDWDAVCETAWLDALVASYEVVDIERALLDNRAQQERGRAWLQAHTPAHPKWQRGKQKLGELERFEARLVIAHACQLLRGWRACRDLYVGLAYLPARLAFLGRVLPGVDVVSPVVVWQQLLGARPCPGDWPPTNREDIVSGVGRIEWWHLEQLRERAAEMETR